MGLREVLVRMLFWSYNQKGTHGVFMLNEIKETRERTRITRSKMKNNRIKSLEILKR